MPDENISTETESVSTSASDPSVESTDSTSEPNPLDDWGKPSDPATTEKSDTAVDEVDITKDPENKPIAKPTEKPSETPEEEQLLEELFTDEEPKKDDEPEAGADKKPEADKPADKPEDADKVDLDKLNRDEQIERQRNKVAKAWADRRDKRASHIDPFYDPTQPIDKAAEALEQLQPERFKELKISLANNVVDSNPEGAFKRAFIVSKLKQDPNFDWEKAEIPALADILNGKVGAATASPEPSADVKEITKELDAMLGSDWRENEEELVDDRERLMAKTIKALEQKTGTDPELQTKLQAAEDRIKELEGTVESKASQDRTVELERHVQEFRGSVEQKMLPFILKNTGLKVEEGDTPEVKSVKENLALKYTGTEYERQNGYETPFEAFAYHESTVGKELTALAARITENQTKAYDARAAGDEKLAKTYSDAIESERVPLYTLLATANKEFKAKHILPYLQAFGTLSTPAKQIKEDSQRVEIVAGGDAPAKSKKTDYKTAEDVWGSMVEDAAREEAMRSAA